MDRVESRSTKFLAPKLIPLLSRVFPCCDAVRVDQTQSLLIKIVVVAIITFRFGFESALPQGEDNLLDEH